MLGFFSNSRCAWLGRVENWPNVPPPKPKSLTQKSALVRSVVAVKTPTHQNGVGLLPRSPFLSRCRHLQSFVRCKRWNCCEADGDPDDDEHLMTDWMGVSPTDAWEIGLTTV